MAEATATATRPARKRAAKTTAAPAKTAAPKAAAPTPTEEATDDNKTRFVVELEFVADTKSYAKWQPPKSSGCVGSVYVPIGTERVRMLLVGPAAAE